jgi:SAM-dependent methyltransferase
MKKYAVLLLVISPISIIKSYQIIKSNFALITLLGLFLAFSTCSKAQRLDVPYVPTPDSIVERMLEMANVGPGDYVIDLGCGDGRIVIAAAKRGAIGHGVDIDPQRIKEARENAEKAGVTDKVVFVEENIFDTDFSRASVITMYLFPSINIRLRPSLLEKLEPGSRIVSHDFDMDEWEPDEKYGRMETHAAYLWIIPAKVAGTWNGQVANENFEITVNQDFQMLNLNVLADGKTLKVDNSLLSGKRISFSVTNPSTKKRYVFNGKIDENEITGIVQVHDGGKKSIEKWTVSRE